MYVATVNTGTLATQVYYGGQTSSLTAVTGWTANLSALSLPWLDSSFVFAGSFAFLDCPITPPQMMVASIGGVVFPGDTVYNWGITAPAAPPTVAVGAAGLLSGVYYYVITYLGSANSALIAPESGAGLFSASVTVTNQQVNLTGIPVSSDPQVTARNIYRMGGTIGGTPLLIGTLTGNATTYTDNLADSAVTGQQLILRQDPANFYGWVAICQHKGRMWGFGSVSGGGGYQSDLWYSNYLQFTSFNSVTQVLTCGQSSEDFPMGMASLDSILVLFKQQTVWLCFGDSQNDFITRQVFEIGCCSKGSIATGFGKVFWLSPDGIYSYDGSSYPVNISDGSVVQGSVRTTINSILATTDGVAFSYFHNAGCRGFITNRTYYLSVYSVNQLTPQFTLGYDLINGGWTYIPYSTHAIGIITNTPYNNTAIDTSENTVIGRSIVLGANSTTSGVVDQWFSAETDLGASIAANWTTNVTDSNAPSTTKQYRYIEVVSPTQSQTAKISLIVDPGTNQTVFGPFAIDLSQGTSRHRISLPALACGYECQLLIATSSTSQVIIDAVRVLGYIKRINSPMPADA
jgi:hypothetical protein